MFLLLFSTSFFFFLFYLISFIYCYYFPFNLYFLSINFPFFYCDQNLRHSIELQRIKTKKEARKKIFYTNKNQQTMRFMLCVNWLVTKELNRKKMINIQKIQKRKMRNKWYIHVVYHFNNIQALQFWIKVCKLQTRCNFHNYLFSQKKKNLKKNLFDQQR